MPKTPAVLVGLAIGDALGMPFETVKPGHSSLANWQGGYVAGESHGLEPGQFTDDTQMARCLALSLVTCKGFSGGDVIDRYSKWFSNNPRGTGPTISKALTLYQKTGQVSGVVGSTGNGSVMRCAPIGAAFRNEYSSVGTVARYDAKLTHHSADAQGASAFIALMVFFLLQGRRPHAAFDEAYAEVGDIFRARLREEFRRKIHTWPGAVRLACVAVECLCDTTSYHEAVMQAVRMGNDTDTQAAVTGALAGAWYGLEGIPKDLVDGLEDTKELQALDIALTKCR